MQCQISATNDIDNVNEDMIMIDKVKICNCINLVIWVS